jgi:serine/threonine protein kinase
MLNEIDEKYEYQEIWTEKSIMKWCNSRLSKLFADKIVVSTTNRECKINAVQKVDGDAKITNKKNRILVFYDFDVELSWAGTYQENNVSVSAAGTITLSFKDDDSDSNFDINISLNEDQDSEESYITKQHMLTEGANSIKKLCSKFVSEINDGVYMESFTNAEVRSLSSNPKVPSQTSPILQKAHKRRALEKYEIIRVIGQGPYGKVKLGRNKETKELQAIRCISIPPDEDEEFYDVEIIDLVGDYSDDDDDEASVGSSSTTSDVENELIYNDNAQDIIAFTPTPSDNTPRSSVIQKKLQYELVQKEILCLKHIDNEESQLQEKEGSQYLVKIIEIIEDLPNRKLYVVQEFVQGDDLFSLIEKEKFSEDKARHIFKQMVKGIKHLHQCNVCHRDLKPEHILVDEKTNMIKIGDFGFCGIIKQENTMFTTLCGTENYVAPEVLAQKYPYDGRKSDIWSLAIILYTMVAGIYPFDHEESHPKLIRQIMAVDYKMPAFFSQELQDLISSILVREPEKRPSLDDILEHPWMKH